jgi:hypothetical protein
VLPDVPLMPSLVLPDVEVPDDAVPDWVERRLRWLVRLVRFEVLDADGVCVPCDAWLPVEPDVPAVVVEPL